MAAAYHAGPVGGVAAAILLTAGHVLGAGCLCVVSAIGCAVVSCCQTACCRGGADRTWSVLLMCALRVR